METVTTPDSSGLARGWAFCPPFRELADKYLPDALEGKPVPGCIHHVDVYSADPEHLVEKLSHAPGTGKGDKPPVWYFFCPVRSAAGSKIAGGRKARAVIGGTWHQENKKAVEDSTIGGSVKTFTYVNKFSSETEKWIMKEFDIPPQKGGGNRVLCKIYRSPRTDKSKTSNSTTTSSSSVSYSGESKKRKAASNHPDAPAPSAPRTSYDGNDFTENVGHVFMEGSGQFEHCDVEAHCYGTTNVQGGETMELPYSEFYGTTETQGGDLEVPLSMELAPCAQQSFFPPSEFYGTTNTQGNGDNFTENVGHVFMQGSDESDHYGRAAYYFGQTTTTQQMPGGETTQLLWPCAQESFLSSAEFYLYQTAEMQGGDIDLDELLQPPTGTNSQLSDEEIQALMLELGD